MLNSLCTAVTRLAAQAGATVLAVSRSADNLNEHVAPLIGPGMDISTVTADVATDEGIATTLAAATRRAEETGGQLYGLVNVAGGAAPSTWMPGTRVTRADWRKLFADNLETMFFMSRVRVQPARVN